METKLSAKVAGNIGSRPCTWCGITTLVALIVSALAMIVGEFEVSADNDGWRSRQTKLADRQLQYERLQDQGESNNGCSPYLASSCWAEAPQSGRRLSEGSSPAPSPPAPSPPAPSPPVDDSSDQGSSWDEECWNSGQRRNDLHVVYRAKSDGGDLLSPAIFEQVCELEGQILALNGYAGTCRAGEGGGCTTVSGGQCLAPASAVSELRSAISGGWSLSCAELAAETTAMALLVGSLATCLNASEDAQGCQGSYFVGFDFSLASPSTSTLAAVFPFNEGSSTETLKGWHDGGDLSMSTSDVQIAYGQVWSEQFEDEVMDGHLLEDMVLVQASMAVSLVFLLMNTRSVFLSVIGLLQVGLSFPVAYFFYKLLCGFAFFPFLNFLGMFVIMGIGVDDLFVVVDKWNQAVLALPPDASTVDLARVVGPDAAFTMLLTSVTTAAAFFATSVVPVAPIKMFAVFLGVMVLADYVLCLTISFPAVCLQHRWVTQARRGKNAPALAALDIISCCRGGAAAEASARKTKPLDRCMAGCVSPLVRKGRFVLIALFSVAISLCAWRASDIPLPKSSDVQLLPDDHVLQLYSTWAKDLYGNSEGESWVSVVWGLRPGDTGDANDPTKLTDLLADHDFDPTSDAAQLWLMSFCEATRQASVTAGIVGGVDCAVTEMHDWLVRRNVNEGANVCGGATGLPVAAASFDGCVEEFLGENEWRRERLRMYDGKLVAVVFAFRATIRWDSSYEELRDAVDQWESHMDGQNAAAPAGVNQGFFTSGDFHWWDTNRSMLEGAYLSIMTALIVVALVVLISTLNLLTTLYVVVAVAGVLLLVIGTVVGMGWELGFLEGICFAILIGLSCDFVLHMAHAYTSSDEATRRAKSHDAIARMGPPVFAAAVTTAATGAVMYGCTILFFLRFGTILVLTMVYAILVSIFFFLAITNVAGPQGNFCSLAPLCGGRKATAPKGAVEESRQGGKDVEIAMSPTA